MSGGVSALWVATDGDGEPTIWAGDVDRPRALLRRCEARVGFDIFVEQLGLEDRS